MDDWAGDFLRKRTENLDDGHLPVVSFDADRQLLHFVLVMTSYTDTTTTGMGGPPVLSPADADGLAGNCRLLVDITRRGMAGLVDGPLDLARQQWIGTSRPSPSAALPTPTRTLLIEADDTSAAATKPFDLGLYSSTAAADGRSMWRTYLDSIRGSSLHPLPWHTWNLQARDDARVVEITSACEWVDFVNTYARRHADMVYPDWLRVAHDFDGVHLTLRAILAIQGICFPTPLGPTAPTYWDIESTLWLRWCFTSASLHEVTE